jgi:uncharacterized protein YndB with AHSA1/START domain
MCNQLVAPYRMCNTQVAHEEDTMTAAAQPATVTRTATLDAPIEKVWEAVTDPSALASWLASEVELDVRPGGVGRVQMPDGARSVLVTAVEAGRRLSLLWWGDEDGVVTSVDFSLASSEERTLLTVVERAAAPIAPTASLRWGCAFALLAALAVPARA